jgi:hypothetical protein
MISRVEPILLSQGESSLRKQNAVLIIAIALVLAAPSVALAYKKKATSSEHFHFSYSETHWANVQEHSNSPTVQPAALSFGTVGKSAGYK